MGHVNVIATPNKRVYGLFVTFQEEDMCDKFVSEYGNQWLLFDTREGRDRFHHRFLEESVQKRIVYEEITLFNSIGKTNEELEDWIIKTFVECNEHITPFGE